VAARLEVAGGALSTERRPRWKKRRMATRRGSSSQWPALVRVLLRDGVGQRKRKN
jgi:hypothetical protein